MCYSIDCYFLFDVPFRLNDNCILFTQSDASSLSLSALRAWCKDKAADYKVPRALWVCDHIPRNAMGKVNKKHLVSVVPKEVYPVEKH
jgi:acyl-CoA synthetase (AMP-forming)/AMP-acid ligase II